MEYNIEIGANIKFTDENGTRTFVEGDNVICCRGEKERYVGKITCIGVYREDESSEPEQAICIDTSKSKTSYSSEVIKVKDITYICKNILDDKNNIPLTKEEQDKKTFIGLLTGLGYKDKAKVENVYDHMKNVMATYDIPFEKAVACTIYALSNNCSIEVPLKEMCGVDIKEIERMIPKLEKAAQFCMGMAIKSLGELLELIGIVNKDE